MKVLLCSDMQSLIEKSGVGRALKHQKMALERAGVEYTLDYNDDYDLIHINTIFPQSYIKAEIAKLSNKPLIYHAHSTEEDFRNSFILSNEISPYFKTWLKICYSTADLILTPTKYSKSLLEKYDLNKPIECISNGIDVDFWNASEKEVNDFRKKYNIKKDDKLIISVGLQIKRKGILEFIELAREMPEYKFIWFGHSDTIALPKEIKKALDTNLPNLIFPGYLKRDDMRIAYKAADIFLFLTHEETEGIVLLEALASKTNVIVRDIPVFDDYKNGEEVYKASNFEEFKNAIHGILSGDLPSLKEEGYAAAKERDLSNVGEKLKEYYNYAISLKNSSLSETIL